MLAEIDATVTIANTFASAPLGSIACVIGRRAGASPSTGATTAKARPQAKAMNAGATNAARQPAYLTRKPVMTAASATPRLPASPLNPIVRPGRFDPRTSIGMPTGW